ncbi:MULTISPECIES: O-antigen polymerase [Mammaliicoccus]|uniref:O-antigen polymerase n=1 Tax=Mammaliicoccus TaxID=2803850 RepID=UPI001951855B|nr:MULTISPECIES: O-antigen polymerase [Mammaliicoccus]
MYKFNFGLLALAFVFTIIIVMNEINIMVVLPLIYILSLLILSFSKFANFKILKLSYEVLGFLRLVIIPFSIIISGDKFIDNYPIGRSILNESIGLIGIEYFIGALFLLLLNKIFDKNKKNHKNYKIIGSTYFYSLIVLVSVILLAFFPSARETISFLVIKTDSTGRANENVESLDVLIRTLFQFSLLIIFIMSSYYFYLKYLNNPKIKYTIIPLILGIINISIIIGERRSYQIYTLLSILAIVSILYKKHSSRINTILFLVGSIVFIGVTLYKELYIFNFSSYSQALASSDFKQTHLTDTLQSYFYGPHNVNGFIEYSKMFGLSMKDYFLDILRSTFGINFIVPDSYLLISQRFNLYLYDNSQMTGHLISSSSYGYGIFGFFFPIVIIVNLSLAALVEFFLRRTNILEIYFVLFYVLMRMMFNLFSNTAQMINHASMVLLIYGIIIIASYYSKRLLKTID